VEKRKGQGRVKRRKETGRKGSEEWET